MLPMQNKFSINILKFNMNGVQYKPVLHYYVKQQTLKKYQIIVDVMRKAINIITLQRIGVNNSLQLKKQNGGAEYLSIRTLIKACEQLPQYQSFIQILKWIEQDIDNRLIVLQDKQDIVKQKYQKEHKEFKIKLDCQIKNANVNNLSINQSYRNNIITPKINVSSERQMFSKLKQKNSQLLQKLKNLQNIKYYIEKDKCQNLYIAMTNIKKTVQIDGKKQELMVVKVGQTSKQASIYQQSLFDQYKHKILFEFIFFRSFEVIHQNQKIDYFFHYDKTKQPKYNYQNYGGLTIIPDNKFFMLNYYQSEDDQKVSQQFYLLNQTFYNRMEYLMNLFIENRNIFHKKRLRPWDTSIQ